MLILRYLQRRKKKSIKSISLEKQLTAILEAVDVTNSAFVEKLQEGIRASVEDDNEGLNNISDDDILVSNVLLCSSQNTNKPLPVFCLV